VNAAVIATFMRWVGLAARLFLGYTFIHAGIAKIGNYDQTLGSVRQYELLPWQAAPAYTTVLPAAEIILGAALIIGLFTRSVAVLTALGLCSFLVAITSAWARGLDIANCGCFGGTATPPTGSPYLADTLRDFGYLAIAVFLIVKRGTALSLDDWLFHRESDDEADAELVSR
jgi:uncharacterized membrane protein YphA (DoxX/SURF4 family)